ncbi:MAG: glycosyltransferase [Coriobacteriales bacterium]|jgi:glycosyltransferase involved in cell wall biosynthesis|nr:glycosyltransferase [Coriobacteriales bacterium]
MNEGPASKATIMNENPDNKAAKMNEDTNSKSATLVVNSELLISFVIPCYNVADYLERAVNSILAGVEDTKLIEIILVDDGSTKDDTPALVDQWQARYPGFIRSIHQSNGGHGEAVNTGLKAARGLYFKVLDADDWLDPDSCKILLQHLQTLAVSSPPDLLITNYVYDKVDSSEQRPIRFKRVLPEAQLFTWDDIGRFAPQQNLLMHTALYRTEVLRSIGLKLPAHTFYVDNIYVYVPLPATQRLYYLNLDFYHYYIGREDQSVQESTMVSRIDQQLAITRIMIDAFQLQEIKPQRLRDYMSQYLLMMLTICAVFLRLSEREDREEQRKAIWQYLKGSDPATYRRLRGSLLGVGANLPGAWGRGIALGAYRAASKVFKFN